MSREFSVIVKENTDGTFELQNAHLVRNQGRRVFTKVNRRNLARAVKRSAKNDKLMPV